jgi:transcription antitermination factor NusG
MAPEEPWRVIHVSSNHEKQVAQHLAARSIEQYLPLYSERKRWVDRNVVIQRPLFSGYIFTRFATHPWESATQKSIAGHQEGDGSGVLLTR